MLCYLATATLAIAALLGGPQNSQLKWESSYGKALEATRQADEPLLVVLDKPNSEEARLAPELLGQEKAEDAAALKPYKLCHVDVTTAYGKKVAKAFHANSFPHVAIIDKTGSTVIFRKTGQIAADEWQTILTKHKSGDKSLSKTVSRSTYKPLSSSSEILKPYCPNCQRNSF